MKKADWTIADKDGNITIPDELDGLFNKLGFQLRFHTFSGKNELQTVVDMVWIASEYFKKKTDAPVDLRSLVRAAVLGRQAQVADAVGVRRATISEYLNGKSSMHADTVEAILNYKPGGHE